MDAVFGHKVVEGKDGANHRCYVVTTPQGGHLSIHYTKAEAVKAMKEANKNLASSTLK